MKSLLLLLILLMLPAPADHRKQDNPLDQLPANEEILTHFGERADFSPDNQRVAFMDKSFGDAFIIDLKSRVIRCLTCNIPGAAFLRVMHLSNGDYVLIGPEKFTDPDTSRDRDNELWYLSSKPGSKPQRLNARMHEGAAISKTGMLISFSETHGDHPEFPRDYSRLMVATLDLSQSAPRLINVHKVYESSDDSCSLEAQDFYDNDSKMTFTCYVKVHQPTDPMAKVMGIDLKTGKVTDLSKAPGFYNECEGIFPDGKYTAVESDRQVSELGGDHGMHNIDIWKLRLDGTGKDSGRLTHFNDYEGWKASNPVISTNSKLMAFQVAHTADRAGVGYGIVLHHLQ
jgi:Tol biopolymer transport system component